MNWKRLVVNLVGDAVHGHLAESRFVERPFLYGGEHSMYQLAFAAAALGYEAELRGWLHRPTFDRLAAAGASPRVELPARPPQADDLVVVPEGWIDPLDYARMALSPARLVLYLLAAPGLFGWPFVAGRWDRPDPLTVPLDRLALPKHFQGMAAMGFRLITHSPGIKQAANAAGVDCAFIGTGRPSWRPPRVADKPVDAIALKNNRWAPLAERVVAELEGLTVDEVEEVSNEEMLARMARAKVLVWPSRIEGHATIQWEARSVGCVPVALSSNRFAMGLDESHGALLVDEVGQIGPAIRRLLEDDSRWEQLSQLGRETALADVEWDSYLDRVRLLLEEDWPEDPARGPRAGIGSALTEWLNVRAAEAQARLEEKALEVAVAGRELEEAAESKAALRAENKRLTHELDALLGRRSVRAALRVSTWVRGDRTQLRAQEDRWNLYLDGVEPLVAARPRVHRFAEVPVIGSASLRPEPLAAWIEDGQSEQAEPTRASIAAGTTGAVDLLAGSLQDALHNSRCNHVALIRPGDVIAPLALERLGQAARLAPEAAVITCDDDIVDPDGRRHSARFRPGPSPDRWLACDDSGSLLAVKREAALGALGQLSGGPAWRHELALALAGREGSGHAHVPMLLCHRQPGSGPAEAVGPAAVERLLRDWGQTASVEMTDGTRRLRRPLSTEPTVEVIICFRDKPELLEACLRSLQAGTDYDRLQIALVDNGSTAAGTRSVVDRALRDARVRLLRDERPFNFAALNNAAARDSTADVLVFLNNDVEALEPAWLEPLLEEALRPEVGAVAPLLLYADGNVQHAGAALGLHGYAGHPFAGLRPQAETPFGRADGGTRNWLAVTAACMVVERWKFEAVGCFDESFVVAGNDVDLCLRLNAAGHRSLCVPHARLRHDESRSRGDHIDPGDFVRSESRYGEFRTVGDPFYNPNLTLKRTDCSVRIPGEEA